MSTNPPQFEDFELLVGMAYQPGTYPVTVITAQAGQATGTLALDLHAPGIKSALDDIAIRNTTEDSLRQFGSRLFKALMLDPIDHLYRESLGMARGAGKRLRLRLRIEPPEISALPWEYLYDPEADLPLAISPHQCLSRYVPISEPVRTLQVEPPLRVLVVVSDPSDLQDQGLPPLKAVEEINRIQQALQPLEATGGVKTDVLLHAVAAELRERLRTFRPHVVHFIGHGGFQNDQGMLVMEDEDGRAHLVSDRQFREFFLGAEDTKLVVLNACEGATQSSARALAGLALQVVRRGVCAAVAMQYPIPDQVALSFAREFYRALAQYYPVDAAVTEARRAVHIDFPDCPDWGTPVLYLRAPDGRLFEVAKVVVTPSVVRHPRRIDAALPSQVQVGKPIDVVVAVRLPESSPLAPAEIRAAGASRRFPDNATAESKPVHVEFLVDKGIGRAASATLEVQVIAPDFEVHGPNRKSLLVPPDRDSELCTFPLSPRIPGELEVCVELYSQGLLAGTIELLSVPSIVKGRGFVTWWKSLSDAIKAAYIAGMFSLLVACIALVGAFGPPIINVWMSRPTATFTPTATLAPRPTGTPTKTPTPMPTPTPYATIQAFSIIKDGKVIDIVKPGETTNVTVGESVTIRAEVLTNTALTDLWFTWHTCRTGDTMVVKRQGVVEVRYEVPGVTGPDCITVKIEKGGALLNDSLIWVNVHE